MENFEKNAWFKALKDAARLRAIEWVASLRGIDGTQKLVLYALASMVDAKYETVASMHEICERANISKRAAQNAIYGSVAKKKESGKRFYRPAIEKLIPGALTVIPRKCGERQNLSNIYRLGVPPPANPEKPIDLAQAEELIEPINSADSAEAPTADSNIEETKIAVSGAAECAGSSEDSARKNQSPPNKLVNSLGGSAEEKLADKDDIDAQYPEPYFLEKIVHAWNECLVPRGAARQQNIDPQMRSQFAEAYRLNTTALSPHFKSGRTIASLGDWIEFLWFIAQSDFLMGRVKLKDGKAFRVNFKYLLGTESGGYPRIYKIREESFHNSVTYIHPHERNVPDFTNFDPKVYWGVK
ncbi:hypothetical protein [Hydrocarboniphaga effusa]|uniref:hypothetical protein n=1 Tax=Hydrocarboniphaga effusa TaxID=243629 RepID=UPI003BAD9551